MDNQTDNVFWENTPKTPLEFLKTLLRRTLHRYQEFSWKTLVEGCNVIMIKQDIIIRINRTFGTLPSYQTFRIVWNRKSTSKTLTTKTLTSTTSTSASQPTTNFAA
ncbi:hypothetical protein HOLleu_22065 [Holothuria leucospilota]|uniref:Uncharacterized protein n=1 Tax=Holothuria leucospilota TaxID=206669 RepID=A0A9Q1H792_HOLLE|nr:hypothetical protein HOLleu_22065 [Holothuria leucospilota]